MRKFLTVLALAILSLPGLARAQEGDMDELLKSDLKTAKVEILTDALALTSEQSAVFWPIYREYDVELSKLQDARLMMIKDYAANYEVMTEEKAKSLIDTAFKIDESRAKLRKKYTGKVSKALTPKVAARFAQTDAFIANLIDLQIRGQVPLVK